MPPTMQLRPADIKQATINLKTYVPYSKQLFREWADGVERRMGMHPTTYWFWAQTYAVYVDASCIELYERTTRTAVQETRWQVFRAFLQNAFGSNEDDATLLSSYHQTLPYAAGEDWGAFISRALTALNRLNIDNFHKSSTLRQWMGQGSDILKLYDSLYYSSQAHSGVPPQWEQIVTRIVPALLQQNPASHARPRVSVVQTAPGQSSASAAAPTSAPTPAPAVNAVAPPPQPRGGCPFCRDVLNKPHQKHLMRDCPAIDKPQYADAKARWKAAPKPQPARYEPRKPTYPPPPK